MEDRSTAAQTAKGIDLSTERAPIAAAVEKPREDPAGEGANGASNAPAHSSDTNVWPTEAEEAAFLSEARERGEPATPVVPKTHAAEEEEDTTKALPKLDELVQRIPPEARELLDDLFRAKFVAVRRVKKVDLKG